MLNKEQLQLLEQGISENLKTSSSRGEVASRADDPGWFFRIFVRVLGSKRDQSGCSRSNFSKAR
ncbi:hypothetical protein AXE65_07685 [Ventosimonas gracilis]|uniref:Uncharacterized protein n=1 Tax=Ventosimonas gracilis TaxID=1680762 RepID=A0A139SHN5_9GAMM|nr:hypothetical protein AXE65_07685 [Ventosimonas gracilis]